MLGPIENVSNRCHSQQTVARLSHASSVRRGPAHAAEADPQQAVDAPLVFVLVGLAPLVQHEAISGTQAVLLIPCLGNDI